MVGIGLGVLSEGELSEVIESGLFGLFGWVGTESNSDLSDKGDLFSSSSECGGIGEGGCTPILADVEGGASFGSTGGILSDNFSLEVPWGRVRRRVPLYSSLFLLGF